MAAGKPETVVRLDECEHTFAELATRVLPDYMRTLRTAMDTPYHMALFATPGVGVRTVLRKLDRTVDISGCYVLLKDTEPLYVGISRRLISRLMQHVRGRTHFDASLAYAMAKRHVRSSHRRGVAMKDEAFLTAFDSARARLTRYDVAFVEISNPVELYIFEAYAALELKTVDWNTFRTH